MGRVGLIGENSTKYVSILLDIWNNGDCAVLIDWRIPFRVAAEMMEEANVRRCFVDVQYYEKLPIDLHTSIEYIPFERRNYVAEILSKNIREKFKPRYSKNEAIVLYSSGTTGKSKGIILSHYAINTNADAIIDYMNPSTSDCMVIVKTISHSSTLTGELLVALKSKMNLVISPTIVPPRYILNNIEKFCVSILCVNPTLLSIISDEISRANYILKTLRTIYVSGSILSDTVYEKAHATFYNIPIYNVYGLSEASPRVTAQRKECCKSNSVGKPIKNVSIALVNEKGGIVKNGECGILHVYSPSLFNGYISGETKHKSLYMNWLNTGDIGYLDANGEIKIVGRSDDVIILDSHKIYPSEVEKHICKIANISECVVTKIDYSSSEFLACLYVGETTPEAIIRNTLKDKLLPYEIPRRFFRCESLPRTLNGKISMREIQKCIINKINKEKTYGNK